MSYNAHSGCSRCKKSFQGTPGEMDYSGFNRETWLKRSVVEHRQVVSEVCCSLKRVKNWIPVHRVIAFAILQSIKDANN